MMKEYANILKQFSLKQRFFVLLTLLIFGSGTYLVGTYFKSDDCGALVIENRKLLADYIQLSTIIREMAKAEAEAQANPQIASTTTIKPTPHVEMDSVRATPALTTINMGDTTEPVVTASAPVEEMPKVKPQVVPKTTHPTITKVNKNPVLVGKSTRQVLLDSALKIINKN